MKNEPLISVIVPIYNVEIYLPRCIKSLQEQTWHNLEIILVDDGSPDRSGEICDTFAKEDSRIKVIHKKNAGVSAARNTGLENSKGKYIGFVDPDDFISCDMYDFLYNLIQERNADIAACSWDNYIGDNPDNQKYCINKSFVIPNYNDVLNTSDSLKRELSRGIFITCNKLFSKESISNLFYNTDYINGEDRLFAVQAICNSQKIAYNLTEPKYHYCHRPNSAGTKLYTHKDYSLIPVCIEITKLVKNRFPELLPVAEGMLTMAYVQLLGMIYRKKQNNELDKKHLLKELRKRFPKFIIEKIMLKRKIEAILTIISPKLYLSVETLYHKVIGFHL